MRSNATALRSAQRADDAPYSRCPRSSTAVASDGSAGGIPPPLEVLRLNRIGSLHLTSAGLADYIHDRPEMLERAQDLFATMRIGAVRVAVHRRYRLAEAARAQSDLEARRTVGSSILLREE